MDARKIRNPGRRPVPIEEYPVRVYSTRSISKIWPVPDPDHRIFRYRGSLYRFCGHCRLPRPILEFGGDAANEADGLYEACNTCRRGRALYNKFILEGAIPPQPAQTWNPSFPTIVTLCGSTRFWKTFQEASLRETLDGKMVFSIGAATGSDDEHFANLTKDEYDAVKEALDELHKRKIDASDEILVLNVGGYIGPSTRSEIEYARSVGKVIRYWEQVPEPGPDIVRKDDKHVQVFVPAERYGTDHE